MKTFINSAFLLFLLSTFSFSQQPGWIEQGLPGTMSGIVHADRGDDLLVFTKSSSDFIYFFDTKINAWTEVNLGSVQSFQKVLGNGQTAFAYSDEYIIGYSSILSQWDTLKYTGTVLDPYGTSTRKGFGCGEKMAYFVTNANIFYVFDAELAEWKQYDFGLVLNASGNNNFWAADNYAGAIFQRNGTDLAKNIAYSLVTHSFAELDLGGWYYYPDNIMHGGYVAQWGDGVNNQKYFGYSAYTNEFKEKTFPAGYDVNNFAAWIDFTSFDRLEEIYVYTCGYEVGDQFHRDVFLRSYSTKSGNWYSLNYDYDPRDLSGTAWKRGGSFSLGSYFHDDDDRECGVWKFYGKSGTHIGEQSNLFKSAVFACGGKVAVGAGDHNVWFHNFETAQTKHKYYAPDDNVRYAHHFGAENYAALFRVNNTSDTMKVFIYNGNTHKIHTIQTYKQPFSKEKATPRVYGYVTGGPQNEVLFYSEILDSALIYLAPEAYGSLMAHNFFIAHTLSGKAAIFDARTAQIHEKNFTLDTYSLNDSLIIVKTGSNELVTFSAFTNNWVSYETDQQLLGYHSGDQIAVGYSFSYAKYWGYSAYDDSFYELVPEGSFSSPASMAGGKTAIVIRTNKIYAFSPGNATDVKREDIGIARKFSLSQNYPNPFNPTTTINYSVGVNNHSPNKVTLKIYDALGRKVATLVDKKQPAGNYKVSFDGSKLSSGVYYYRLQTDDFISTKKMILLK